MSEIRIVLIGKTGEGKSRTGNTILGHNAFHYKLCGSSVTKTCQVASAYRCGRTVKVIDTPGFCDTHLGNNEIRTEVTRAVHLSAPGPHVFILVVRPERFTVEEEKALQLTKEYFGNDVTSRLIVLFTRRDQLDYEGISVDHFLSTAPRSLQLLIREAGNRYIAFSNNRPQHELDSQTQLLLNVVDQLLRNYGNTHYKPRLLLEIEAQRRKEEERKQREATERERRRIQAIEDEERKRVEEEGRRRREENERRLKALEEENARLQNATRRDRSSDDDCTIL